MLQLLHQQALLLRIRPCRLLLVPPYPGAASAETYSIKLLPPGMGHRQMFVCSRA